MEQRDLKTDLEIIESINRNIGEREDDQDNFIISVVLPHALQRAIAAEELLAKKDATLKKLEEKAAKWEKAFVNADKQYLKMEKAAAQYRRENERLRKELKGEE